MALRLRSLMVQLLLVPFCCCICVDAAEILSYSTTNGFDDSTKAPADHDFETTDEDFTDVVTTGLTDRPPDSFLTTEDISNTTFQREDNVWHNSVSGQVSEAQFHAIKNALWEYAVPVILPFGILGNILGVWFLVQQHYKQSFYLFLLALISADLVYLIFTLLQDFAIILEVYDKELAQTVNCYTSNIIQVFQWNTYSTCTHLVCFMTFERLINVSHPFWKRNEHFQKQTVAIIFTIIALNVTLRVPILIKYEPTYVVDPGTNKTACKALETMWSKENAFWQETYTVIMLAVTTIGPFIATILGNISIIVYLSRQRKQRAELFAKTETRAQHYQQYITTLTLITLSVCLSISLLPSITMSILGIYLPETFGWTGSERFTSALIAEIGYFLRVISSSTDFVVYVLMSESSRKVFMGLIKKKLGFKVQENYLQDLDTITKSTRQTDDDDGL